MTTAAVVLAAGRGSRLDVDHAKPLLRYRGRPLVAWALDAAVAGGCTPVLLVVGHEAGTVAALAPDGVRVVSSPHWADGISASLRAALEALGPDRSVTGVCVGLADQPLVGAEAYRRLVAAAEAGAGLAVATYDGVRGNPVLLARTLWADAIALTGDTGARQLMRTHPVVEVDCTGTGHPADVDTLEDLVELEDERPPPRSAAEPTRPFPTDNTEST